MRKKWFALLVAAPLALAACQTKEQAGTLGGAVVGGLAGTQVGSGTGRLVATGVGTLVGALIGKEIGARMDATDRMKAENAFEEATTAPVGDTITWRNPDSGHHGTVTPVREGVNEAGRVCREYQTTIFIEGDPETRTGVACRQTDGTWEVVS